MNATKSFLRTQGSWFVDSSGRRILFRGINLGGGSKTPDPKTGSFVGRPLPLEHADDQFRRLRKWGFNGLRFLVTWEAVEPSQPGVYDQAYLDYVRAIVEKAGEHGFYVFIDPHQDAWSRFSGGTGAPRWTLELAGFDVDQLDNSEAAIVSTKRGARYETMMWPNNWTRLASSTMFGIFFAGEQLAPFVKAPNGQFLGQFLRERFCASMAAIAKQVADLDCVLGFDAMNEPVPGYMGIRDLAEPLPVYNSAPQLTGLESLSIPSGHSKTVPFFRRKGLEQSQEGTVTLNPNQICCWTDPSFDIWRRAGVWDLNRHQQPVLLKPNYFADFRFYQDGVAPFVEQYTKAIQREFPRAMIFIEGEPGGHDPLVKPKKVSVVNASHWYDLLTLLTKKWDPEGCLVWGTNAAVTGRTAVRKSFSEQIRQIVSDSEKYLEGCPTLIGEFGVPMDLNSGASFKTEDFSAQEDAIGAYYEALDANWAHSALWNYTFDNSNEHGDGWNGEDLSIWSQDQCKDPRNPYSGARGLKGFCRPSLVATPGIPVTQKFDSQSATFELSICFENQESRITEVFAPQLYFGEKGPEIEVSSGKAFWISHNDTIHWTGAQGQSFLKLRPRE